MPNWKLTVLSFGDLGWAGQGELRGEFLHRRVPSTSGLLLVLISLRERKSSSLVSAEQKPDGR